MTSAAQCTWKGVSIILILQLAAMATSAPLSPQIKRDNSQSTTTRAGPHVIRPVPLQLGNYTIKISTRSKRALALFNLGMMHEFGFNQIEARKAMDAAVEADPDHCPMCYWGVTYVNGPFLNHPVMSSAQAQVTYTAIRKAATVCAAVAAPGGCTIEESGLIQALKQRHPSPDSTVNQTIGFVAYAEALDRFVQEIQPGGYFVADAKAFWPRRR